MKDINQNDSGSGEFADTPTSAPGRDLLKEVRPAGPFGHDTANWCCRPEAEIRIISTKLTVIDPLK